MRRSKLREWKSLFKIIKLGTAISSTRKLAEEKKEEEELEEEKDRNEPSSASSIPVGASPHRPLHPGGEEPTVKLEFGAPSPSPVINVAAPPAATASTNALSMDAATDNMTSSRVMPTQSQSQSQSQPLPQP